MISNRQIFICFLLILSMSAQAQLTLDSCYQMAKSNYPLIQQYELIDKTTEYSLSNATKSNLPQVSANIIGGIVNGFPSGMGGTSTDFNFISVLQVNQKIWDGGAGKSQQELISSKGELEKAQLDVSMFELEERVNNLFFGILLIQAQMEQLNLLSDRITRNLGRLNVAVQNGVAYKSDIAELKVEMLKIKQQITELRFNNDTYRQMLGAMIGNEIPPQLKLVRPPELTSHAFEINRPELSLFSAQKNIFESQDKLNKSMIYPKIGLLGFGVFTQPGINLGPTPIEHMLIGGISASWQLGSLYSNENNKSINNLNRQKIDVQQGTFNYNLGLSMTQKSGEISKIQQLIKQDKEMIALRSEIRVAYENKHENGVVTLSQLMDRMNDESQAQQSLLLHEIQYLMSLYQYKNISGN